MKQINNADQIIHHCPQIDIKLAIQLFQLNTISILSTEFMNQYYVEFRGKSLKGGQGMNSEFRWIFIKVFGERVIMTQLNVCKVFVHGSFNIYSLSSKGEPQIILKLLFEKLSLL